MRLFWTRYGSLFLALLILFITVILCRPVLPIDETRYLGVAWEMHTRQDWFLLTMNYAPYHHKPPMLFWLINMAWSIFGVSRWAAMIPLFLSACASLVLCRHLALRLLPENSLAADRTHYVLMGSLPFLIYSSMIMFDVTMMALVLGILIALLSFARKRTIQAMAVAGILLGLAVLTKGPVAYLYTLPVLLLGPIWFRATDNPGKSSWYGGGFAMILLSTVPVLLWLIPMFKEVDHDFARTLIWDQSAGRISGHLNNAHTRPVYFYLLFLPLLVLPWAFLPGFWRDLKTTNWPQGFRFLLCWFVPVFTAFSFISGKQPHYLVPLLPAIIIAVAFALRKTSVRQLVMVNAAGLFLFIAVHCTGHNILFPKYDLTPVSTYLLTHPHQDVAFAGEYHGEFSFLSRRLRPLDNIQRGEIDIWLMQHPHGLVVLPNKGELWPDERKHQVMLQQEYRGKSLTILK